MARRTIVARFGTCDAAQRAAAEIRRSGMAAGDLEVDANGELSIAVDETQRSRVMDMLRQYAPATIDDAAPGTGRSVTLSGAPADHPASPGELPDADSPS